MNTSAGARGQVISSAAEIYDAFFVPALFGEWAGRLCDAAEITPGSKVLDVACGTGATTREISSRTGPNGITIGLDRNEGMLAVARSRSSTIDWIDGLAEEMPFPSHTFDAVLCQFGLMFFDDKSKALNEIARVVRPGGTVALTVWDDVRNSPGYAEMIAVVENMFGHEAADALRAPFILGDRKALQGLLEESEVKNATLTTETGTARFASIREWVRMDVRGWTVVLPP